MTIRRTTLIAAIEAGIDAAPGLWEYERSALRKVGLEATTLGGNFDACPLTQAGLYDDPDDPYGFTGPLARPRWDFVLGYDRYLHERNIRPPACSKPIAVVCG